MVKKTLITLTLVLFLPRILYVLIRYQLFRLVLGQDNALLDATDLMRDWRGLNGMLARRKVLRVIIGSAIGNHVTVYSVLFSKSSVKIGNNAYIGFDCNIGNVDIGCDVLISDGVFILSGGHQHGTGNKDQAFRFQQGEYLRISIGDGAWIGAGAIIMASVGVGAIVGAGSVVTKPVPDHQVVVGVPAKPINRCSHS